MDHLFDPLVGLGLNAVRYNIGGGENPEHAAFLRPGADVQGWQGPDRAWNFSADPTQRWVLAAALSRGVDIVEVVPHQGRIEVYGRPRWGKDSHPPPPSRKRILSLLAHGPTCQTSVDCLAQ